MSRTSTKACSVAIAIGLFLAALGLHATIARQLFVQGVYASANVLFESDPGEKHAFLALGAPGRKEVYPVVFVASRLVVGMLAEIVEATGGGGVDPVETRLCIALWIVPVLSGIKAVLTFVLLASLGIRTSTAGALSLASVFLFSNVIFGTIPETYGVSGVCLTAILCMAAIALRRGRDFPLWAWVAIAAATTATLASNAVIVAIVLCFVFVTLRTRLALAIRDVVFVGFAAVALTFGVSYGLDRASPPSFLYASASQLRAAAAIQAGVPAGEPAPDTPGDPLSTQGPAALRFRSVRPAALLHDETPWWRTTWLADTPLGRLPAERGSNNHLFEWLLRYEPLERITIGFPVAVANSIVAASVTFVDDAPPGTLSTPRLTTVPEPGAGAWRWLASVAVLAALATGAARLLRSGRPNGTIALICLAILAYNGLFHTVWGGPEIFLYSQHWLPAVVALLAGLTLGPERAPPAALRAAICIGVAALAAVNLAVLVQIAGTVGSRPL